MDKQDFPPFVAWFRSSSPYIDSHRGRTFVVAFGGEAVADDAFAALVHDFALLNSLGIRLVLVHGARPQIDAKLKERREEIRYVNDLRVTDATGLACVKEAVGNLRVEIEALFSMGLANSPVARSCVRVASGNYITAQPVGVRDGVDYQFTGEVRRVDVEAIRNRLAENNVVLLSPLGYSPSGEVFNLNTADIASAVAIALQADKLIVLSEHDRPRGKGREPLAEILADDVEQHLSGKRNQPAELARTLRSAANACRGGVKRVHLVPRRVDGGLLLELFTRDGIGTLISSQEYERIRMATVDDVGGLLELLAPLETDGILVKRSRDRMETEIDRFTVIERDGTIIGCVGLYPFVDDNVAEIACLAIHRDYRDGGRGERLLQRAEKQARSLGIKRVFVLTTRTAHWFRERGFGSASLDDLPVARRKLYNYQRQSKIFFKALD